MEGQTSILNAIEELRAAARTSENDDGVNVETPGADPRPEPMVETMAPEEAEVPAEIDIGSGEGSAGDSEDTGEKAGFLAWKAFTGEGSTTYLVCVTITATLLVVAAAMGRLTWLASGLAVLTLLITMIPGGKWAAMLGGVIVIVIGLGGLALAGDPPAAESNAATFVPPPAEEEVAPDGSLGIKFEEIPELWNGLDQPPSIDRGIIRSPEPGTLDGFYYRFDQSAFLAGAYHPSTDYVHALVATADLSHPAASQMYLHLCFALHPYSPECLDSYFQFGLEDGVLEDYAGVTHTARWELGEQSWRLTIHDDELTLRVLGDQPD